MAEKTILFDILARDRASDAFQSAGRSADQLGDKTSKMGARVKTALMAGAAAAGVFALKLGKDAVAAAKESIKVGAQTDAVLTSTGASAWISADQIGEYAHQLQMMSGVSDETIQSGQNMLLTFTNIKNEVGEGNDIFNQATAALLDMSVATGQDMSSAAVQLGKALNDPIRGVTSLSRVGVQFTDVQREQIRTMVTAGDTAGAQAIILAELTREFGGSAKAAGDAMTAGERLSLRWGDMQEQLGMWLIPKIDALIGVLVSTAEWVERNSTVVVPLVALLGSLALGIIAVNAAAKIYAATQAALNIVLSANPIGIVVLALAALVAGLVVAYRESETFRTVVDTAFSMVRTAVAAMWSVVEPILSAMTKAINTVIGALQRAISLARSAGDFLVGGNILSNEQRRAIAGRKAWGGPVSGGKTYLVGERGPEMFVPSSAGTIVPNEAISGGALPDLAYWAEAGRQQARAYAAVLKMQMRTA